MNHDLLLTWVSERGTGTWNSFREVHEWLASAGDGIAGSRASATVRTLSMLGHMEIDWHTARWAVAPTVLTMLPDAGGYALLVGSRTRPLINRMNDIIDASQSLIVEVRDQPSAPSSIFIGCEDEDDIAALAQTLHIAFVSSVSDQLSAVLPPLVSYLRTAHQSPAPRGVDALRLDARKLQWSDVEEYDAPGLYRFELYGRPEHRWVSGAGHSYDVDFPIGVYLELSRSGTDVIEYVPDGRTGTLRCPAGAPLPTLHARAAAMCTGLAPLRESGVDRFLNVPEEVARRIANALSQKLKCLDKAATPKPRRAPLRAWRQ